MLTRGRAAVGRTLRAAVGTTVVLTRGRTAVGRTLRAAVGATVVLTRGRAAVGRTLRAAVGATVVLTGGRAAVGRALAPPPPVVCMSSSLSAIGAPSGVPPRRAPGSVVQRVVPHARSSLTHTVDAEPGRHGQFASGGGECQDGVVILVGTSGWQYRDWRGPFYPQRLPQRLWLEHFAGQVRHGRGQQRLLPAAGAGDLRRVAGAHPGDFCVAVKMSRYLTHIKRLRDPAEPVARFLGRATALGDRLGPVLLQLPPNLPADVDALDATLRLFPADVRVAVEPRHPTWWTDATRAVLERRRAALVWADRLSRPITPLWRTTDFGYLRLHEGRARPWPRYGRAALAWVRRLAEAFGPDDPAYVYFNNDPRRRGDRRRRRLRRAGPPGRAPGVPGAVGPPPTTEPARRSSGGPRSGRRHGIIVAQVLGHGGLHVLPLALGDVPAQRVQHHLHHPLRAALHVVREALADLVEEVVPVELDRHVLRLPAVEVDPAHQHRQLLGELHALLHRHPVAQQVQHRAQRRVRLVAPLLRPAVGGSMSLRIRFVLSSEDSNAEIICQPSVDPRSVVSHRRSSARRGGPAGPRRCPYRAALRARAGRRRPCRPRAARHHAVDPSPLEPSSPSPPCRLRRRPSAGGRTAPRSSLPGGG